MLAARPRWCAASQENRSVRFRERRLDVSARSARKLCGAKRCSEQCAFARESEVGKLRLLWPEPRRAEDLRLACAETSLHRAEPHASYIHIRRRECMPRVRTRVARVTTHSVGTGRRRVCERCTQALSADVCQWCWLRPRRCATAVRTRLSRCMCVLSFAVCLQHSRVCLACVCDSGALWGRLQVLLGGLLAETSDVAHPVVQRPPRPLGTVPRVWRPRERERDGRLRATPRARERARVSRERAETPPGTARERLGETAVRPAPREKSRECVHEIGETHMRVRARGIVQKRQQKNWSWFARAGETTTWGETR
jgi:hypothetical protein